jgi:serine/threonine protein kinase
MRDTQSDRLVAVKQMPNTWIRECHEDFVREHPTETEMPWQDIGCTRFLNSVNFRYGCSLHGVYRGDADTYVTTSFATEGDLFSVAQAGHNPGPEREAAFAPIVVQLLTGMRQLHDMHIVHRDISLENVLLTKEDGPATGTPGGEQVRVIDYGMASTGRVFKRCVRGKASYQAPEMHGDQEYDAFLSDTFSVGVILYASLLKDYPWLSTRPGGCKCFDYVKSHGFRMYCAKRKVRGSDMRVAECISEDLMALLEGLFALDPAQRLTLGEKEFPADRRSVWDEPWVIKCREIAGGCVNI